MMSQEYVRSKGTIEGMSWILRCPINAHSFRTHRIKILMNFLLRWFWDNLGSIRSYYQLVPLPFLRHGSHELISQYVYKLSFENKICLLKWGHQMTPLRLAKSCENSLYISLTTLKITIRMIISLQNHKLTFLRKCNAPKRSKLIQFSIIVFFKQGKTQVYRIWV